MTNKEKALEAARIIKEEIGIHSIPRVALIIDWCLTWKDQQFKEYLEKKKESRRKKWGSLAAAEASTLDMIIKDFFKEEK